MFYDDEPKKPDWKHELKVAVITAALTSLATGVVGWGLDEIRELLGRSKTPEKPEKPKEEV